MNRTTSNFDGKIQNPEILIPYSRLLRISNSCPLEDIVPMVEIFKDLLNGRSTFSGPRLFQPFQIDRFPKVRYFPQRYSPEMIRVLSQGHVRTSRNHENEGFEGSHIIKSKSYKSKMEQNSITDKHIFSINLL